MEAELGEGVMPMFMQGGGGDVHPFDAVMSGDKGFEAVARTGRALGDDALRILGTIQTQAAGRPSLKVRESSLCLAYREDSAKTVEVGVMAVVVNDDIALAVISGEPFVQHQLDLVAKSPFRNTFLLGYAYFGRGIPLPTYLPSRQAIAEGGYGSALGSANFLEVGAGEKMVAEAVRLMTGLPQE
jgi:hypothetical protein